MAVGQTPYRKFVETNMVELLLSPSDVGGSASATPWVSLAYSQGANVVLQKGTWANAAGDVTLEQAQDNSGTGAKSLRLPEVFTKTSAATVRTRTDVSGDSYTLTTTDDESVEINVHSNDLDRVNGFTHFRVNVGSPGAGTHLLSILGVFHDPRYASEVEKMSNVRA